MDNAYRFIHIDIVTDFIAIIESSSRLNDCENLDLLQICIQGATNKNMNTIQ